MVNHATMSATLTPRGVVSGGINPNVSLSAELQTGNGSGSGNCKIITKTKAEWNAVPTLMSHKNTLYVYSDYREETVSGETVYIPRLKIGDGTTYVIDLPFSTMSITQEDVDRWNSKSTLSVIADDETETLIFSI